MHSQTGQQGVVPTKTIDSTEKQQQLSPFINDAIFVKQVEPIETTINKYNTDNYHFMLQSTNDLLTRRNGYSSSYAYEPPCYGFPLEINIRSRIKPEDVFPIKGNTQFKKCIKLE